ncbi:glycosyltransferase family 2 protein [Pontibacter diazotrophicus]|uniref:glycosyltransferase family 2 protein n=1 Tax=Pontibacter diazotrophicus TaxID=1400979 RepID=UPI0011C06950|nr:glycosyltransferase family 2 protein [Pontibacter diazotrophicus]
MKNSISFIMPCFNCSATMDASIMSIINTNFEEGDEIILIDDASIDDTYAKALSYSNRYSFIKVLRHHNNKGTAAAGRNTGIDQASSDLIFCLDSDNILRPNSIRVLKEFLVANALDAAAFGRIDYFSENSLEVTSSWILTEKLSFIDALNDPMKTPCGSGNYLYTKALWKKAGRHNEFLGGAYDSELFGLKILAEGAKFWTLPETSYLHRNGYESTYMREYSKRNASLLFLAGLIDYWNQVHEDDVDYIFGKGRLTWMDNIAQKPLRPKSNKKKSIYKRVVKKLKNQLL